MRDLPKDRAMEALKKYRKQYFGQELTHEELEEVYNLVGGRLSYLNRVAKALDYRKLCESICEAEKTWFLNKCWILGPEMDDDVMDQQKYAVSVTLFVDIRDRRTDREVVCGNGASKGTRGQGGGNGQDV